MSTDPRNILAALGLVALGALASQAARPAPAAGAQSKSHDRGANMQVVMRTNDPIVFLYDEEEKRLLMLTTANGSELKLAAVRNLAYDQKIHEYRLQGEKGLTVNEVRKAVEEEEARERERAQKRAEEEAKKNKKKEEGKPAGNG